MKKILVGIIIVLGLAANSWGVPLSVGFQNITNNGNLDIAGQLHLNIFDQADASSTYSTTLSSGQLLFVFTNNVGVSSNVTEIYVDSGPLNSLVQILNQLGNDPNDNPTFTIPVVSNDLNPGNLPGGTTLIPAFQADLLLSSDSANGSGKGIDSAADAVGLIYSVQGGLVAVQNALSDGSLRVGLHVRSIDGDWSDGFVNNTPVPEPGTMMLLGAGFLGLAIYSKRRRNS